MNEKVAHLVRLFGSHAKVAKAAGADGGYVHRWPPKAGINPQHQLNLLVAAKRQGLPVGEVIWALDPKRCPCCHEILDPQLREEASRA